MRLAPLPSRRWWDVPGRPALLLATGLCVGPQGLNLLRPTMIDVVDPAIPVALVALGILLPFVDSRRSLSNELVPVLAVGALVLGFLAKPSAEALLYRGERVLEGCGAAGLIALAGSLLLARITSPTDRRVVVLALLLLTGGLADFLAVPGLLVGALVIAIWKWALRDSVASALRDVDYMVGPLVAAMLLSAGARLEISPPSVALAGVCVLITLASAGVRGGGPSVLAVGAAIDLTRSVNAGTAPLVDAIVVAVMIVQLVNAGFAARDPHIAPSRGAVT